MNRFALIAAGLLTLALTACGGHDNKQPVGTTTTTTQPAPSQPAGGDNQTQNH